MVNNEELALPPDISRGLTLLAVTLVFLILALICYAARMYVRIRVLHYPWWDDWVMSAASVSWAGHSFGEREDVCSPKYGIPKVCAIVEWALVAAAVQQGFGRPHVYLSPAQLRNIERLVFFFLFLWAWAVTLVKISVALMMLRIKKTSGRWRFALGALMAVQAVALAVNIVMSFLQCRPYYVLWTPEGTIENCWPLAARDAVVYTLSGTCQPWRTCNSGQEANEIPHVAVFVASDIVCSLLPVWFIYQVPRPLFEKITFIALMSLGLFASAAALAKVVLLARVSHSKGDMWADVNPADLSIWTNIEECVGIMAASVPVLKPYLDRLFTRLGIRPATRRVNVVRYRDRPERERRVTRAFHVVVSETRPHAVVQPIHHDIASEEAMVTLRSQSS
jgi:hypothetical protein